MEVSMSEYISEFLPGDAVVVKEKLEFGLGPTKHLNIGQRYIVRQRMPSDTFLIKSDGSYPYERSEYIYLEGITGGWLPARFEKIQPNRKFRMIRLIHE
jgi:hypothetical protein